MQGFSNTRIKPKRRDFPHIVFMGGYWRVSPFCWDKQRRFKVRWDQAHKFVRGMNDRLFLAKQCKRSTLDELI